MSHPQLTVYATPSNISASSDSPSASFLCQTLTTFTAARSNEVLDDADEEIKIDTASPDGPPKS